MYQIYFNKTKANKTRKRRPILVLVSSKFKLCTKFSQPHSFVCILSDCFHTVTELGFCQQTQGPQSPKCFLSGPFQKSFSNLWSWLNSYIILLFLGSNKGQQQRPKGNCYYCHPRKSISQESPENKVHKGPTPVKGHLTKLTI